MKSVRFVSLVLLIMAVAAPAALAADFGVRAGRYNDAEDEFVGVEVAWDSGSITWNPNIEYVLTDDDDFGPFFENVTLLTGNFDVLFNFGSATVRPYLGGGLGLSYFSAEGTFEDINETDALFNVIGGVKFNLDFLTPYAQVKYFKFFEEEAGDDDIAFVIGLRF